MAVQCLQLSAKFDPVSAADFYPTPKLFLVPKWSAKQVSVGSCQILCTIRLLWPRNFPKGEGSFVLLQCEKHGQTFLNPAQLVDFPLPRLSMSSDNLVDRDAF